MRNIKAKIIIVGEPGAGKSFIAQTTDICLPTQEIGVSIGKITETFQDTSWEMRLITWTITKGRPKESTYLEQAEAAIIVCDLTTPETLELIPEWANRILNIIGDIPLFFVANKADLGSTDTLIRFQELANKFNSPCFPIQSEDRKSAKLLFRTIARELLKNTTKRRG